MEEISEVANLLPQELSTLPQELIIEILVRLPVKILLKFRCVSKSWLSLLSNTEFHKTHVNFSIKNPKITGYTIVGVASVSGLGKICHVYTVQCENPFIIVAKHDCPPKSLPLSSWLLGSCNGLVCLTSDSFTLMLLNPCTGNFNVFPDTMSQYKVGAGGCYVRYGFGYDASIQDYKVVKIFSFPQNEGRHENMVKVYSLKANSWSTIQGFNSGCINGMVGVFSNGALHWDVCHPHISRAFSEIVTLDLATERYGTIALPSYEDGGIHWTLGVSRGHLVACCNYETNKADMWVMKEYGVEKSWTKLVSISLHIDRRIDITPLYVAENGDEVLVKLGTELILYNSRNASFKRLADYVSGDFLQVQEDAERGQSSRAKIFITPSALNKKIEAIIDHQLVRGKGCGDSSAQFLVHWKGQPPEEATWEKYDDLWQFKEQIRDYLNLCGAAVVANSSGGECSDPPDPSRIFPP